MAVYFFESSALVKRYVIERGSTWVIRITTPAVGNSIHLVRITGVEVVSAITRVGRSGRISVTNAINAIAQFRYEFTNSYQITEVTGDLVHHAMALAEAYGLRGYDAVQLAAALKVNAYYLAHGAPAVTLVSADAALNAAAIAEGLTVDNPNWHP